MAITLPNKLTLECLKGQHDRAVSAYAKAFKKARILDRADRDSIWEALNMKFPPYQILNETKHVSYIKNNFLASIYSVGKSAQLVPTSENDKQVVEDINQFLNHFWSAARVGFFQFQAGERAALINLGITQVGWDNNMIGGNRSESFYKGAPVYKNINPLKFMRDPYAVDLESASYCITWDDYHKEVILAHPGYSAAFKEFLASEVRNSGGASSAENFQTDAPKESVTGQPNYYRVIIHWVREGKKIHEIHTINNMFTLQVKEDIKPSEFPFALCYCNLPNEDLIGNSEAAKIFANSVAYNYNISNILTADYKNLRPPRFVNTQSGLNIAAFAKCGNDADRVFPVTGDASKAVHYQQYPNIGAQSSALMGALNNDVQIISGVDGKYTGRDTGSVTTTGGVQDLLSQATLIDAPKIVTYEEYALRLTKLTLANFIEHGGKRTYLVPDPHSPTTHISKTIDFAKVPADSIFSYEIMISSELPKNKQRMAEFATSLMEMQMQYSQSGQEVDLITPEEWLMFQDPPFREYMLERMGMQRHADLVEQVAQTVVAFSELAKSGMDPQDAIGAIAQNLKEQKNPAAAEQAPIMDMEAASMGGMPMM